MAHKILVKALLVYGLLLAIPDKPAPFPTEDTRGLLTLDGYLQARAGGHGDGPGGGRGSESGGGGGTPSKPSTSHQGNQGTQSGGNQQKGGGQQQGGGHDSSSDGEPDPKRQRPNPDSPIPDSPSGHSDSGGEQVEDDLVDAVKNNGPKGKALLDNISSAIDRKAKSKDSNAYWTELNKNYRSVKTDMTPDAFVGTFASDNARAWYLGHGIDIRRSTNIKRIQIWGTKQEIPSLQSVFDMFTGKNPDGSGWAVTDRTYRSGDANLGVLIDRLYPGIPKDQRLLMADHIVEQFQALQPGLRLFKLNIRYVMEKESATMAGNFWKYYEHDDATGRNPGNIVVNPKGGFQGMFYGFAGTPIGSMWMYPKLDHPDAALFRDIQPAACS